MRGRMPAILGALGLATAAAAQQAAVPAPQETPPPSDDVVVTGLRDLEAPGSAVTHRTLGSGKNGRGPIESRQAYSLAERFAKCAIRPTMRDKERLRAVLDGTVNSASQRFWQGRFVSVHATCAQDVRIAQRDGLATVWTGYDTSYYDRGAMMVQALRTFVPNLSLTAKQTADPAVQARFNAREEKLARFRLPVDRQYFETAICVVRMQPELAVQLVRGDDYRTITEIEAAMVNRARVCVGNAKQVYFDPMQFRFHIADALYRWVAAARGVDSLIPSD